MGRAVITANIGEGLYKVRLDYDLTALVAELADIEEKSAEYGATLAAANVTLAQLLAGKRDAEEALNAVLAQWHEGLLDNAEEIPPDFPDTGPPGSDPAEEMADALFTAVNAARVAESMDPLTRDASLDAAIADALEHVAASRNTTDRQRTPEIRATNAGYSYDAAVGVDQLLAFGHTTNAQAIAYWLRVPSARAALLSDDAVDVGVAAYYAPATPNTYSRGLLLSAPGAVSSVEWPEKNPADEAAEDSDDQLERIETPKTDSGEPDKLAEAVTVYRKAVSAYQLAEQEVARIKTEQATRDARENLLESIQAAAAQEIWAWAAAYVDDLAEGETVSTAEIPGWYLRDAVEKISTFGVRNDPGEVIPSSAVIYSERDINIIGAASTTVGRLRPAETLNDAAVFLNAALEPGWAKWLPLWRYGTVTARTNGLCSVTLESTAARALGDALVIDESLALTDVPIVFLPSSCWTLIAVGAEVLVQFDGQDRDTPQIIGWRREPLPCSVSQISWGQVI